MEAGSIRQAFYRFFHFIFPLFLIRYPKRWNGVKPPTWLRTPTRRLRRRLQRVVRRLLLTCPMVRELIYVALAEGFYSVMGVCTWGCPSRLVK